MMGRAASWDVRFKENGNGEILQYLELSYSYDDSSYFSW